MSFLDRYHQWREDRATIRAFAVMRRTDQDQLATSDFSPLHQATRAMEAGDPEKASQLWEQARQSIPDHLIDSGETVNLLLGLERFDELRVLLLVGHRRAPRNPLFLTGLARLAERLRQFDEATKWWSKLRRSWPTDLNGWIGMANCLEKLNRNAEVATLLQSGTSYFSDKSDYWIRLAWSHESLGEWQLALRAWDYVADTLSKSEGYVGAARARENMDDWDGALQRLAEGIAKFAYDPDILSALAIMAERSGNLQMAITCWANLRMSRPQMEIGYREGMRCHLLAGQREHVDPIFAEAARRFPDKFPDTSKCKGGDTHTPAGDCRQHSPMLVDRGFEK